MRKWMKSFAIAGIALLLIGTAVTALAAVVGNVREERLAKHWEYGQFDDGVLEHIEDVLQYYSFRGRNGRLAAGYDEDGDLSGDLFDDGARISPKEEMKLAGSFQKIAELEIEAELSAVKIVENSELDDEIRIYLKEEGHARVETEAEGEELSVKYMGSRRNGHAQGIVEIPAGYQFHKVELKAEAAYIEAAVCNADELDAGVQAGGLRLDRFQAADAELSVEAGSLTARGSVVNYMDVETKAGTLNLTLEGREDEYNYYLENAVGNVVIGDSAYSGLSNDKKMNNGADKAVNIECAAGSVKVQFTQQE